MRRLAVIDLDGTLLQGNSLHIYMRIGMKRMLRQMRLLGALRLGTAMAARMLRIVSHSYMKFTAASVIGWDDCLSRAMREKTANRLNPIVVSMIEQWESKGYEIVIATAAFEFYASAITPYDVIGTAFPDNPSRIECRGRVKAERIKALADRRSASLQAVVTDSLDDLPLLKLPFAKKYYITRKHNDVLFLSENGIKVVELDPKLSILQQQKN